MRYTTPAFDTVRLYLILTKSKLHEADLFVFVALNAFFFCESQLISLSIK